MQSVFRSRGSNFLACRSTSHPFLVWVFRNAYYTYNRFASGDNHAIVFVYGGDDSLDICIGEFPSFSLDLATWK
jgi:hypothetical protein